MLDICHVLNFEFNSGQEIQNLQYDNVVNFFIQNLQHDIFK